MQSDPKPEDNEFGYYVFDTLPSISTVPKEEVIINMAENAIPTEGTNLNIGISKAYEVYQKGIFYVNKYDMLNKNHLPTGQPYFIRDSIPMQYVKDNKQTFETMVLP